MPWVFARPWRGPRRSTSLDAVGVDIFGNQSHVFCKGGVLVGSRMIPESISVSNAFGLQQW